MRDLREGDALGPYVLDSTIDRGAFGRVWRAHDAESGKTVAIKVLASDDSNAEHARARTDLERLAAAAARDSRHIVRVLSSGHAPVAHIVMEFVDGTNLRDVLSDRGPLAQDEAIRIALEVADALRALHRVRVVHRDVKPANILLDRQGEVRLTDFGIAKILGYDETVTLTQQNLLSAPYAAPEVWEGAPNPQSDLYAFGAVVFEMLAGRPPFQGDLMDLFRQHRADEPDFNLLPAHTAPSLRELVLLCLRKAPEERPPNADACIRLLEHAREELRRQPERFGPWIRIEADPDWQWAWRCRHERSGEEAVVEVHFAEDEAYGETLRAALAINPRLVPLGAEGLLGTNRLLLGDDEGWPNAPEHNLVFWVARQDAGPSAGDEEIEPAALLRATDALIRLIDAANANNVRLRIDSESAVVLPDGGVYLRRPGLPPAAPVEPRLGAFIFLRSLPLSEEAAAPAAAARDLRDLREKLARPAQSATDAARPHRRPWPLLFAVSLAAVAIVSLAAAVLAVRGNRAASPVNAIDPTQVAPAGVCAPLVLPAPTNAARQACGAAGDPAFEQDESCARGMVCSIDSRAGAAVLHGNDQTIAFVDANGDLALAREANFAAARLLEDGHIREPAWSPDGRYIAYVLTRTLPDGVQTELWVVDTKEPASGLDIFSSTDTPTTSEYRRRRISQPHWGAGSKTLTFLWQSAAGGPELWSIDLPQRGGALDTRELRLWSGVPKNLSSARLAIEGLADARLASFSIAADGAIVAEFCSTKDGACGLARWTADALKVIVSPSQGTRFIAPQQSGDHWLALALDGADAVLLQVDIGGGVKPVARVDAAIGGAAPDAGDLSLTVSTDGAKAVVGTLAGLKLVTISDGSVASLIVGKWAAWYGLPSLAPGVSPPLATPFATPALTPSASPIATFPPGSDADLEGSLLQASCVIGQELVITVRNLGPSTLDRDVFISVTSVPGNVARLGSTNKGLTGLLPGQVRDVPTGYIVQEPVRVVIDNPRDRNPQNNVVTCSPR